MSMTTGLGPRPLRRVDLALARAAFLGAGRLVRLAGDFARFLADLAIVILPCYCVFFCLACAARKVRRRSRTSFACAGVQRRKPSPLRMPSLPAATFSIRN